MDLCITHLLAVMAVMATLNKVNCWVRDGPSSLHLSTDLLFPQPSLLSHPSCNLAHFLSVLVLSLFELLLSSLLDLITTHLGSIVSYS